jgi:broad specificity phosphatase PhoE
LRTQAETSVVRNGWGATALTRLLVTRHGATTWNRTGKLQGRIDVPLSDLGHAQAKALAARLADTEFAHVYRSDTVRAEETARILAGGRRTPVTTMDGLTEMDLGDWQGLTFTEVAERWPESHDAFWHDPGAYRSPVGGESFAELRRRTAEAMARIVDHQPSATVLVVTHSLVIKAMWLIVNDRPLSDFWVTEEFGPAGLTVFDTDGRGFTTTLFNDTSHLDLAV